MSTIQIAIAEDNQQYRDILTTLLNLESNIKVIFDAENGVELLKKLKSFEPDIAIIDFRMPIIDGLQTLIALKKSHPQLKIIINTSMDEDIIIKKFKNNGANSYILKRDGFKSLVNAINEVYVNGFSNNDIFSNNKKLLK